MSRPSYTTKLKVTILGEAGIGKSSIIERLIRNTFSNMESTIGASFFTYDDDEIRYEIWDTAGNDRFLSLAPMYYRGSNIIIMVYDLNMLSTIERLNFYFNMIESRNLQYPNIIMVGNKLDLINHNTFEHIKRTVPNNIKKMTKLQINDFVYVSAKNGDNISELRQILIKNGLEIKDKIKPYDSSIVTLNAENDKSCSC